jgi:hypothetical protein
LPAGRDRLDLPKDDVQWGARMLWTLGQVPAITNETQLTAYAQRLQELLARKIGMRGQEREVVAAFLRTHDGALAIALAARIDEFTKGAAH